MLLNPVILNNSKGNITLQLTEIAFTLLKLYTIKPIIMLDCSINFTIKSKYKSERFNINSI